MTDSVYQPLRFNNANYGTVFNPMQEENFLMPSYGQQAQASQALSANASASTPDFSIFSPSTWNPALRSSGALSSIDPTTGQKMDGWGGLALGTGQALLSAYMGMKTYGMEKDKFNFQKNAWNKEFEVNKNLTNSRLEDRQNRRFAESGGKAPDAASYMAKYGVK